VSLRSARDGGGGDATTTVTTTARGEGGADTARGGNAGNAGNTTSRKDVVTYERALARLTLEQVGVSSLSCFSLSPLPAAPFTPTLNLIPRHLNHPLLPPLPSLPHPRPIPSV